MLYSSQNVIRIIKSRKMRWSGPVTIWGHREMHTKFLLESLRGRHHLEDLGIDGKLRTNIINMDLREIVNNVG
jgi:hypothetical protein